MSDRTTSTSITTDLAVLSDTTVLDRMSDPAHYVITACERAKTWLVTALEQGDINQIAELRSQAEAIRVYTAQKQLGTDAQLAATEIVRRAERGLGLAIRAGQDAGTIRRRGQRIMAGNQHTSTTDAEGRHPERCTTPAVSPLDYANKSELSSRGIGVYAMTDNVSDEQFDAALSMAKKEGNLSRANLVRTIKEHQPTTTDDTQNQKQNIKTYYRRDGTLRQQAIQKIATTASGIHLGLKDITELETNITREDAVRWRSELLEGITSLSRLRKLLKEYTS